mgnify:CR=1
AVQALTVGRELTTYYLLLTTYYLLVTTSTYSPCRRSPWVGSLLLTTYY